MNIFPIKKHQALPELDAKKNEIQLFTSYLY